MKSLSMVTALALSAASAYAAPTNGSYTKEDGTELTLSVSDGKQVATLYRGSAPEILNRAVLEDLGNDTWQARRTGDESDITAYCTVFQLKPEGAKRIRLTLVPPQASACRDPGVMGDLKTYMGVYSMGFRHHAEEHSPDGKTVSPREPSFHRPANGFCDGPPVCRAAAGATWNRAPRLDGHQQILPRFL